MATTIEWTKPTMERWSQNNIYKNGKFLAATARDQNKFTDADSKKGDVYRIAFSDGADESALSDPWVI